MGHLTGLVLAETRVLATVLHAGAADVQITDDAHTCLTFQIICVNDGRAHTEKLRHFIRWVKNITGTLQR